MVFDPYDAAALTEIVRRSVELTWEQAPRLGFTIAPLFQVQDRKIRLDTMEVHAFGKGRFKAEDATPPVYVPKVRFTEETIDLALLEEISPIKESLLHQLESKDEKIVARAGADVALRGKVLQLRNERLTEWMIWEAVLTGQLTVAYDDVSGQNYVIDYGIPSSHIDIATLGADWDNTTTSTPIDDLRAVQKLVGDDSGAYGTRIYMNSDTYVRLERSDQAREYLTEWQRGLFLPSRDDLARLLYPGGEQITPQNAQIIVSNAGYREDGAGVDRGLSNVTRWIPEGVVLVTTEPMLEGEPIADVADGLVTVSSAWDQFDLRQGMQSEMMHDHRSKTQFLRQASARMVRIRRPAAFATLRAYTP